MDGGRGRGRGRGCGRGCASQANPPLPPPPVAMNGIYECLRELTSLVQHQNRNNNNNHTGEAHSLAQVPGNGEENRRMIILREFLRQNPPYFQGSSNPLDADRWIRRVTKVFDGLGVAEDFKVSLATLEDPRNSNFWKNGKIVNSIMKL